MEIINAIYAYFFSSHLGMIELVATITLLICVWQAAQQIIWTWVWGTIGVILYGYIFFEYKLYSDMMLQWAFYLPLQFFGWYWWSKKGPTGNNDLPVSSLNNHTRIELSILIMALTLCIGLLTVTLAPDASVPYWDAWTTTLSIVAQVLMMKKIWESWALWVTMDIFAIAIYWHKELYVTSGLYVVFLVLAMYGLNKWYITYRRKECENF